MEKLKNVARPVPQSVQADPHQELNEAGGYTFTTTSMQQASRFLILGTESSTFYADENRAISTNYEALKRCDPLELLDEVVRVSVNGLAVKNDYAIFALAYLAGYGGDTTEDINVRQKALSQLDVVCRIPTDLFKFLEYVKQFRGRGPALRKAISNWYTSKTPDQLAYLLVKYRQREGWTHRDAMRIGRPASMDPEMNAALAYGGRGVIEPNAPHLIKLFESDERASVKIEAGLPWEALSDEALAQPDTWRSLIAHTMPQRALIRQLPKMTRLDVFDDEQTLDHVVRQLTDETILSKARIHPISVLTAMKVYAEGSNRNMLWQPEPRIIDALDDAFYRSFKYVEPTGKRYLVGVDVSGSMSRHINDVLSAREVACALSMTLLNSEEHVKIMGFTKGFVPLNFSRKSRLDDVVNYTTRLPFDRTDCAVPMLYAMEHGLKVDTFVIITDNETWYGSVHPHVALQQYRKKSGINAKCIVLATSALTSTIADPSDPGMLDISGFSSAVPQLISNFSKGF